MRIEVLTAGRFLKTNTYIVGPELSKDVVVIDPAGPPRRILDLLAAGGLRVTAIVNTHAHADHVWGNHALAAATGAPVAMHEAEAEKATRFSPLALLARGKTTWSPKPARLLADGDVVSVGTVDLEVIHVPGHSPGSICLRYKKWLFTGDTLMAASIGDTKSHEDWKALSGAIMDRLFILSDDIGVYPGHGPRTTIERERKANVFVRYSPDQIERWMLDQLRAASKKRDAQTS